MLFDARGRFLAVWLAIAAVTALFAVQAIAEPNVEAPPVAADDDNPQPAAEGEDTPEPPPADEPTPAEPAGDEPTPAEPTPAEPTPAEPAPAELTPVEPSDVVVPDEDNAPPAQPVEEAPAEEVPASDAPADDQGSSPPRVMKRDAAPDPRQRPRTKNQLRRVSPLSCPRPTGPKPTGPKPTAPTPMGPRPRRFGKRWPNRKRAVPKPVFSACGPAIPRAKRCTTSGECRSRSIRFPAGFAKRIRFKSSIRCALRFSTTSWTRWPSSWKSPSRSRKLPSSSRFTSSIPWMS